MLEIYEDCQELINNLRFINTVRKKNNASNLYLHVVNFKYTYICINCLILIQWHINNP